MADKPRYQKVFTPLGEAVYPHLTEADTKFDADGSYHTKLRVSREEAEGLIETLEEIRDEFVAETIAEDPKKKRWTIAPVVDDDLDDEGEETGDVLFKAKLKAHVRTKAGKEWDQEPAIFDSSNQRIEDISAIKLWGGSKIRLQCEVIPYAMAAHKIMGVSLRLRAIQIVELASGGQADSPFDAVEGGDVIVQKPKSFEDSVDEGDEDDDVVDY